MSNYNEKFENIGCIIYIVIIAIHIIIAITEFIIDSDFFNYVHVILSIALCICLIWITNLINAKKELNKEIRNTKEVLNSKRDYIEELKNVIKRKDDTITELNNYNAKLHTINKVFKSRTPFSDVADLVRDLCDGVLENEENYFRYKRRPSVISADIVQDIRGHYGKLRKEFLLMKYKYDYLLKIFPELSKYVEEEEALISLSKAGTFDQFQDEFDHVRDYISSEEYSKLSIEDRNQLALDRYKSRRRDSSWIAGVEYEMYCSYMLRKGGFHVIEHGVEHGLEDLGRDIIATKCDKTYIIQCKRYGERIEVHENTICQLYGTALHYKLTNPEEINLFSSNTTEIIPMLITTGILSKTAKEFASVLKVAIVNLPMGDYPMIKCNINNGHKIYHLPFDQQYWRTKIDQPGEFYASSVKEAMQAGFRRAYRYNLNNN